MPTSDLKAFRGSYSTLNSGDSVSVDFVGEDFAIIFTTNTICQIKVKVDGVYQQAMIWHTGEIAATSDVFDLGYSTQHSYYDGVDNSTSENPSVLKLATPLTYGSHTVIIEAVVVANNAFHFEGLFVFSNSAKKNVRSLDSTMVVGELTTEMDLEEIRNEVVVVGAHTGLFQRDGLPVNPNNPIHIRTYSKAVDLSSIYDRGSDNYIGRMLPFEVYNEHILEQRRADHIALNALKSYRKLAKSARFTIPGDPRLEPYDAIGFQDKKLNVMTADDRVWIRAISEKWENGQYTTTIEQTQPREPIPSFESKEEPDINAFDGEPLINIELRSQGKRIAGNDATASGNVVTIGTSPGWVDDMWVDYFFIDHVGHRYLITSNTASTLNAAGASVNPVTGGNWSISFDPFDTDQKGAPLEIHYDQVINAKVRIMVIDAQRQVIAEINKDAGTQITQWGSGKVYYWSGAVEYGYKEGKKGCYVNWYSCNYVEPLRFLFKIESEKGELGTMEIDSCGDSTNGYDGSLQMGTTALTHSPYGAFTVYPWLRFRQPLVKIQTSGNSAYAEDVQYRGKITAINYVDPGNDDWRSKVTLEGSPIANDGDYVGYLFMDSRTYQVWEILDSTAPDIVVVSRHYHGTGTERLDNIVLIVGQSGNGTQNIIHDTFKSSDNNFTGLKLTLQPLDLYANKTIAADGEGLTVTRDGNLLYLGMTSNTTPYDHGIFLPAGTGTSKYRILALEGDGTSFRNLKMGQWDGVHQNYYSLGYIAISRNKLAQVHNPIYQHKILLPYGPILLNNLDLYVQIKMDVIKVKSNASGTGTMESFIRDWLAYDSGCFVKADEWSWRFNPDEFRFGENQDVILQHGDYIGWYFLLKISLMDRAGRFIRNNWGSYDSTSIDDNPFLYLAQWAPESGTPLLTGILSPDSANPARYGNGILQAALVKNLTVWH